MNTITKTASTTTIVAIDLGKYKSVACVHDQGSGEYRFTTFDTSRAELGNCSQALVNQPVRQPGPQGNSTGSWRPHQLLPALARGPKHAEPAK